MNRGIIWCGLNLKLHCAVTRIMKEATESRATLAYVTAAWKYCVVLPSDKGCSVFCDYDSPLTLGQID